MFKFNNDNLEPSTFENTDTTDIITRDAVNNEVTQKYYKLHEDAGNSLAQLVDYVHSQLDDKLSEPRLYAQPISWRLQPIPAGLELESTKNELLEFEQKLDGQLGANKVFEKWMATSSQYQAEDAVSSVNYKLQMIDLDANIRSHKHELKNKYELRCNEVYKVVMKAFHKKRKEEKERKEKENK